MKSFLVDRNKKPICKWGLLPDNVFFEGTLPEGYSLAVSPSKGIVVVDVDRHGSLNGFLSIPDYLSTELAETLHYPTKNNGAHFWFIYTGNKVLNNKTSGLGIDLRVGGKGYVIYYPPGDIRSHIHLVKETSQQMNEWLEKLFS